ncbi:Upstream activation factor subunit spp27 [Cytospora mali]|uniref:Upstream activation factor subunit spp27 n=1 Tax=Cytospora mali TaxID=578113 RepID=A0A194V1H8_CYTMA|nr:Upstream activation factor subunit spp27 [Valsa mali var. pyri (nom. inval.)]
MSTNLTSEEIAQYTSIIDGILATADLATISRKKVRQALERALGGKDLSDQKNAIKVLIEQRFDAISEAQAAPEAMPTPPHKHDDEDTKNGIHNGTKYVDEDADADADEDASAGEIQVSTAPSKKRSSSMVEDEDARLARELQAQENRLARGRQTRGGNNTPKAKPKGKKKSSAKVKTGDDSDVDTEDSGTVKKRKAGGGFQKEFNLSFPLQEVVGAERLSRPQVVKKLWEHIKANDLQDPSDKRQIRCDEKLQAVFKQTTVNMFAMNKLLGNQLYPLDE